MSRVSYESYNLNKRHSFKVTVLVKGYFNAICIEVTSEANTKLLILT